MNRIKIMIHLHVHSTYSFLDGGNKIKDCVARAKELGMPSIALTDHNHIGGWYDFKNECEAQGIKPIFGCEMYQTYDSKTLSLSADDRRQIAMDNAKANGVEIPDKINGKKITKKQIDAIIEPYLYDTKQYHLVLLAMNQTGLNNLIKLQSEASDTCTYNGRYCCDMDMLRKYNEGIICLSACLGGFIPNKIIKGKLDEAEQFVLEYKEIFGDRFYLEIQPLLEEQQLIANVNLIEFANKHNIKVVATNDVHYTREEDADDHDTLLCVGLGKKKEDEDRMRYSHEFWIRSYDEMISAFERHGDIYAENIIEEAINNTVLIADRIEDGLQLGSKTPLFPEVYVPKGLTPEQYLTLKSYKALYKYKSEHPEIDIIKYEKRMYEELDIINSKGYAPYMLKIFENVEYCEANDIPVGPGRGSAAGSLCLFVNGGTKVVDPIKYDLLFFRFLTKDRIDPPDVDMDYSYYGRDKLIAHLEEVHGHEAVCHIGTYTEMGVKSGLKDFGRVLNIDFGIMNNLTKKIDEITEEAPGIKFKHLDGYLKDAEEALEEGDDKAHEKFMNKYNEFKKLEEQYPELFRLARKFEGTPRNMGSHASGILVMPCPVTDYFPTRTVDGIRVALFTGPQLESLGAIKLDILGLKTLDVLDKTLKSVDKNLTVNDLYKMIERDMTNKKMYEQIQNKETEGLFQVESNLFKGLVSDIVPTDENDICAILSIGRPGPLSAGMHTQYANRKNGHEIAVPQLKGTDSITENTYHTIIYQEQCMLIAKVVAGFDDSQADSILRKALAKKKADKMELARRLFIYGKINEEAPADYDESNTNQPIYDPTGKHGSPVLGGINNGYTETELTEFWEKLKGYASYLFNKSHSASYTVLTLCTMYLKKFHAAKFFAALLSMQETEEKVDLYCKTAKEYGITIKAPDINKSEYDFTEVDGSIYYGLRSIKGVGETSIPEIIANRPYINIQDAKDRLSTKAFNKRIATGLIKSGCFDFYNENRYELMNELATIRKEELEFNSASYNANACMQFEKDTLGTCITYTPWWDTVIPGSIVTKQLQIKNVQIKKDKRGNNMAFLTLSDEGVEIKAVAFATVYKKSAIAFDTEMFKEINVQGKKDERGQLVINKVLPLQNNFNPYAII